MISEKNAKQLYVLIVQGQNRI